MIQRQRMDKRAIAWTPREWTRRQEDIKQDGGRTSSATWVLRGQEKPETGVSGDNWGGVPPYLVIETLVVNGKLLCIVA